MARTATAPPRRSVTFNRLELNRILNLYGRMVADGDGATTPSTSEDRAVFRYSAALPKFRFTDREGSAARATAGMYSVISATGDPAPRHELERVLLVIDRKLALV